MLRLTKGWGQFECRLLPAQTSMARGQGWEVTETRLPCVRQP